MEKDNFIDLCKRMIVEYYNRYLLKDHNQAISIANVNLIEYKINDDEQTSILVTNRDEYLRYVVTYDIKTQKVTSYAYCKY